MKMMTTLGKLLVFGNLVLSLLLAAIAVGIATNRIDWAGSGSAGEAEGEHFKKRAEIAQLQDVYRRNRARWKVEVDALAVVEEKRPLDQQWYAEQLKVLKDGKDLAGKEVANPVKMLVYQDGVLKIDNGRPVLAPNPDMRLKPADLLAVDLTQKENDIAKTFTDIHEKIKEEERLTFELNGLPGKKKGLRDLLAEVERAQRDSVAQLLYMREQRINREDESNRLLNRRKELLARIEELKKVGVAVRQE